VSDANPVNGPVNPVHGRFNDRPPAFDKTIISVSISSVVSDVNGINTTRTCSASYGMGVPYGRVKPTFIDNYLYQQFEL